VKLNATSRFLLFLAVVIGLGGAHAPIQASQPTGYDVAAAVNAYRQANGYYALNPHPLVMAAAQAHADWIVETGQGGHIGAGGSDETVRVSWTGYGGGAEIKCDENWGGGRTVDEVMSGSWSDWVHQEVMLNAWGNRYTDIGGGVSARGDGRYVFVLNVCLVVGQEGSGDVPPGGAPAPPTSGNPQPAAPSNFVFAVKRADPQPDGSIIHKVMYGQTLIAIANAYEVSIEELRALNNMAENATIIWAGEELLVKAALPASQASTASAMPGTGAATPTRQVTPTAAAVEPTATPELPARGAASAARWGIWLLGISGGVMVLLVLADTWRKQGQKPPEDPDSDLMG
jgi:LysM repeat protein